MHAKIRKLLGGAVAAVTALGVQAVPSAHAGSAADRAGGAVSTTAPTTAGRAAAGPTTAGPTVARTVFTATGDRVTARTIAGATNYATVPSGTTGAGSTLRTVRANGHAYVMPLYAQAYLGRSLDLSLFDVTALSTAADPSRLAVRIAHTGPRPVIAGVTVTADSAGVASGYLTLSSARAFGAALQRQFAHSAGTGTGPFGRSDIGLISAADAAAPVVTPLFAMHTLVVKGVDPAGRPMADGFGFLLNVDDGRKYANFLELDHGQARVSVPAGNYSGIFEWFGLGAHGRFQVRSIPILQYSVRGEGQTLTVDARQATAVPTIATPRPAQGSASLTYSRSDALGFAGVSFADSVDANVDYAVKPTPPARIGTQSFTVAYQLLAPGRAPAYTYDLYYSADHVSADQHRRVSSAQVHTVHARYDADRAGRLGAFARFAIDPAAFFSFIELFPVPTPTQRTEYVYAQGGLQWAGIEFGSMNASDPGELYGSPRSYPAGTQSTEVWRHGPLGAGIPVLSTTEPFTFCYACRKGNLLTVVMAPFTDSDPTHAGRLSGSPDGSPFAHFTLSSGSRTLFDRDDYWGAVVPVPAGPAAYKAVLDVNSKWTGTTTSTASHTEFTFGSAKGSGPNAPAGWYCGGESPGGCRVLPVLTAKLHIPLSPVSTLGVGTSTFEVDAAQVQGAATAPVRGATLQLRPAGAGWTSYPLTPVVGSGGSAYRAAVDIPASLRGRAVDVRYTARDAAGATFDQTVSRAFIVAGTADRATVAGTATGAHTAAGAHLAAAADLAAADIHGRSVLHQACGRAAPGAVRCLAQWRSGAGAGPSAGPVARAASTTLTAAGAPVDGYGPADIGAAYHLDQTRGAGQTVAIVDAYDNPKVAADLAAYRKAWGLPPCTAATGCFRKVNQRGGTTAPEADPEWGLEIALDVQAVSAACPRCRILLVEADSPDLDDIGAAENRAVAMGAKVVSNSYRAGEFGAMAAIGRKYYTHPGVSVVASSGDEGFTAASFPAVWGNVIAVGGTTLTQRGTSWSEKAWAGAGSGCSAYVAKPVWQVDTHCRMRTTADVSAVADPNTGLAVYDTYGLGPYNGWVVVGGTSLSTPLISGMIGLAGNGAAVASPRYLYQHRGGLKDVVGGSNGFCGGDYLCTGKKGYDGPTGLGSPRGISAL